jgi:hypothetical protein
LVLFGLPATHAQDMLTIRMEGYAEGVGFVPRQVAIRNAKQAVLEQVLRSLTGKEDLRVFRPILRHADAYIPDFDVLRHDTFGDGTSVEIDARLLEKPLHDDIAAIMLPRLPDSPTVQVIVGQRLSTDENLAIDPGGMAETTIVAGLNEHRVKVVGIEALAGRIEPERLLGVLQGSLADGATLARALKADVVLIGTVVTEATGKADPNTAQRHKATANLRVYRGSDGKVIDDISSVAAMHGVDPFAASEEAVRDACRKVIRDSLTAAVITVLGNQTRDNVLLTLRRPSEEARVQALQMVLEGDPQVSDLELLFYEQDLARMRFGYSGSMAYLVELMDGAVVNGRKLTVDRVVGREMDATFQ